MSNRENRRGLNFAAYTNDGCGGDHDDLVVKVREGHDTDVDLREDGTGDLLLGEAEGEYPHEGVGDDGTEGQLDERLGDEALVDAAGVAEELQDLVRVARVLLLEGLDVLAVERVLHQELEEGVHPFLHAAEPVFTG